jgi:hypothetical protein
MNASIRRIHCYLDIDGQRRTPLCGHDQASFFFFNQSTNDLPNTASPLQTLAINSHFRFRWQSCCSSNWIFAERYINHASNAFPPIHLLPFPSPNLIVSRPLPNMPAISLSSHKSTTSAGLLHSRPANSSADSVAVRVTRTVEGETNASNAPTSVTLPPVAHVSPSVRLQDDMMIDFFGGRRAHQSRSSSQSNPPPYSPREDVDTLPAYPGQPDEEPVTLARYMFLYGFGMHLLPPFIALPCSRPVQCFRYSGCLAHAFCFLPYALHPSGSWESRQRNALSSSTACGPQKSSGPGDVSGRH